MNHLASVRPAHIAISDFRRALVLLSDGAWLVLRRAPGPLPAVTVLLSRRLVDDLVVAKVAGGSQDSLQQVGRIEVDGMDIRTISLRDLRRRISVILQFPAFFQLSVAENIALGSLAAPPTEEELERAARDAGAHDFISRLPKGYGTLLGRLFREGTELSGGEWHHIALARAFFRRAPIVVRGGRYARSWAAQTERATQLDPLTVG